MRNRFPLAAAAALLWTGYAHAGPLQATNTTTVMGSDGQSYGSLGADFSTTGLAVSSTSHGGSYALTLAYTTTFNGLFSSGDINTYYPDIFLRVPGADQPNAAYNLAIALGDEGANGGQAAGLYTPGSIASSQSIWSGRSGYLYGAGFQSQTGSSIESAPVVMLSGSQIFGTHVASKLVDTNTQANGAEIYKFVVTISGVSAALAATFDHGFDAFWGTGDCGNGAFVAKFAANPFVTQVPEPSSTSLALLGLLLTVLGRCPSTDKSFLVLFLKKGLLAFS